MGSWRGIKELEMTRIELISHLVGVYNFKERHFGCTAKIIYGEPVPQDVA